MKIQVKGRLLFAAVMLACSVPIGIHFMLREPRRQQVPVVPVALLEPLRMEHSAPRTSTALRPALLRLLDPGTPARTRIDLAIHCERDLNNDELMALLAEVSTPAAADIDPGWHAQYFHEICLQLHHHSSIRTRFARVLLGVSADVGRSHVEREYAVQHMREVWHRAADDVTLRQSLVAYFKSLVQDSPELAGPALLSLHFLGNDPHGNWNGSGAVIGHGEIEPLVVRMLKLSHDKTAIGGVMAALRVAGDRSLPGPLPSIKQVAADSSVAAIARMAAVSVVAKSGKDSAVFLQSIKPGDPLVDQAIRLSLKNSL